MVSLEQVRRGAVTYVSKELAPLMPTWQGVLVEALAPTVIEAKLKGALNGSLLAGTGFVDGATVNVDEVYKLVKNTAMGRWPMEVAGFKLTEADLDKLYRYIREG
jgi:hypothetical protein